MSNWITRWWKGEPDVVDERDKTVDEHFDHAMRLVGEVKGKIRERARSTHPFRRVLVDLLVRPQAVVDTALIADAYEMTQEARIFLGPPNGHG